MSNLPDFVIEPPDAPQRQKHYKGHPTARARLASLVDAGEVDNYTTQELAQMLHCSERTVNIYLASMAYAELYDVTPDELPLQTTRGRMLILMDGRGRNCEECVALNLCNFLVRRDCMLACERPLIEEVNGVLVIDTDVDVV